MFKTAGRYGFDSLILTDASMQVLDGYVNVVRPLLKSRCEFVLVTRNGGQHSKLGDVMSKHVFDAIGTHIHLTRYREIVETQTLNQLRAQSKGFCRKNKNIALQWSEFIIKSRDRGRLQLRATI